MFKFDAKSVTMVYADIYNTYYKAICSEIYFKTYMYIIYLNKWKDE